MREINPIPIPMKRRSKEEIKAYLDGFEAGVKLCTEAINENAQRFRVLVAPTIGGGEGEYDRDCAKCGADMRGTENE